MDRRASEDSCLVADCEEDVLEEAYEEPAPVIAVRSNFNPLANFTPAVQVGEDGTAEIAVKIPDNLTRYRIWAVAASHEGLKYGLGESLLTAQLPLVVRCRCAFPFVQPPPGGSHVVLPRLLTYTHVRTARLASSTSAIAASSPLSSRTSSTSPLMSCTDPPLLSICVWCVRACVRRGGG